MDISKENKNSRTKEIISTVAYIVAVVLIVFLILKFVGQRTVVNGDSMCNTLQDGQSLIMDKISYRFQDPKTYFPRKNICRAILRIDLRQEPRQNDDGGQGS